MTLTVTPLASVPSQPWLNGGGTTQELVRWPDRPDWALRISVARIERDGPFSAYQDVERWFALIDGGGLTLGFEPWPTTVMPGDEPLRFSGALAPNCQLLGEPSLDLNLMVRGDRNAGGHINRAAMQSVQTGVGWSAAFEMRGLFTAVPGRWFGDGEERELPAGSLLWSDALGEMPWVFESDAPSLRAWWLGFTPHEDDDA